MAEGGIGRLRGSIAAGLSKRRARGRRERGEGRSSDRGRSAERAGEPSSPPPDPTTEAGPEVVGGQVSGTSGVEGTGGGGSESTPGTDGIEVSYAPEHDGDADPGEVVWAWVPYEDDPTQGKDRPVLVLGHDGPLLAGVPLSSKSHEDRRDEHDWVAVGTGAWDDRRRPSYADASRLLRFRTDEVRREGSALDRARFDQVLARVARIHGWTDRR